MGLTDWISKRIEEAGAYRESDTKRDGFVSYAAESHAIGYGLAVGVTAGLALLGVPEPLAVVIAALGGVGGLRRKRNERVWKEIREEFQYFAGSVGVGVAIVLAPAVLLDLPIRPPV